MPKGVPSTGRGAKGILRPHVWRCGPDYEIHPMYQPWLKAKAQSDYRNRNGLEQGGWELSFEDWVHFWRGRWHERGRKPENLVLTRLDDEKPWNKKNCVIMTRLDKLRIQGMKQKGIPKGPRKPK